jgi:hypothetical protein
MIKRGTTVFVGLVGLVALTGCGGGPSARQVSSGASAPAVTSSETTQPAEPPSPPLPDPPPPQTPATEPTHAMPPGSDYLGVYGQASIPADYMPLPVHETLSPPSSTQQASASWQTAAEACLGCQPSLPVHVYLADVTTHTMSPPQINVLAYVVAQAGPESCIYNSQGSAPTSAPITCTIYDIVNAQTGAWITGGSFGSPA